MSEEAQDQFTLWLQREMPPGTVIGSPTWWAPRIWRAVENAQRTANQPNVAPSIEWRLTTEKINDLQIDSIKRLIPLCKAAHFVNVRVRINGTWEEYQADWIKHMVRIERAADPTPAPQPKAARFYGFRSEKLAEERAFHADMVFTEREQAEKVNTAPTTEDPIIHAQHDETGRTWTGPRSQLPRRYFEITSICCLDYPLCDCNSPPEPDNAPTLLTNPWNGEPRDIRDVESDPTGILMVEPGKPLRAADQPNVAPSIEWRLTTEKINDLQIDSIKRLIPLCKAAHFVNVRVRINGTWEEYQADWIKHMVRIERAADPTPAPQPKAARFYGFRSEKLAEERAFHADMVFTEREQAEKVNTAPTTEVQK